MSQDYLLPVRAAMMKALKHDADLLALIPAASVYPATVPASRTFPFSRFGSMIASPFRASGLDSSSFRVSIQGFTKPVTSASGAMLRPAEDNAIMIGSAIKNALDGAVLPLTTGGHVTLTWLQSSPMRDGDESDAWMTTVTFLAEVAG